MSGIAYVAVSSDIVHEGILNVIQKAAELGEVVVGVLADNAIATYKRMPLLDERARVAIYASLKGVSRVLIQPSISYANTLRDLKPDYVVHGDDWISGVQASIRAEVIDVLHEWGGKLIEVPYTKGVSASSLEKGLRAFYGSPDSRRGMLRRLLGLKKPVRIIEASNGLSGLIVENARTTDATTGQILSYDGMWISSLCDSTFKGKPDIELVDFTSRMHTVEEIMEVTTKPIIFDGDTGGRTEWFTHNVQTLERIGVSAIIIEDKTGLKQNSLFGKSVRQIQEEPHAFACKIAAGKRAQRTREFMIIARIESLIAGKGVRDALDRAGIYLAEGGADGIMIHSKERSGEDVCDFVRRFRERWPEVPVILVPTTYNHMSVDELAGVGANIIIYANQLTRAAYVAMRDTAQSILVHGRSKEVESAILPIDEVLRLIPKE